MNKNNEKQYNIIQQTCEWHYFVQVTVVSIKQGVLPRNSLSLVQQGHYKISMMPRMKCSGETEVTCRQRLKENIKILFSTQCENQIRNTLLVDFRD